VELLLILLRRRGPPFDGRAILARGQRAAPPGPVDGETLARFRLSGGYAMRKHLNKIVVVIFAIVFASWFLLWPDEEEPVAPPPPDAATTTP